MVESGHNTKTIGGKEYWTTGPAADYVGISKTTLLGYVRSGRVSHIRMGTTVYYTKKWLDEFLDDCIKIGLPKKEVEK